MENKKEIYKLFQLVEFFTTKHNYIQVQLQEYKELVNNEAWLFNLNHSHYQLIRVSFNSSSQFSLDKGRIDKYFIEFSKRFNFSELGFLDIHICNDKYIETNEPFDHLNINNDFYDGFDVKKIFPNIHKCIHQVVDEKMEMKKSAANISKAYKKTASKFRTSLKIKPYLLTFIFILICLLNFIIFSILKNKYSDTSALYVFLGADYKTFTLGLHQLYRLFTYAFVHFDLLHLTLNMFSLYSLGRYVEYRYGHKIFLLIICFSIIISGLSQNILSDNGICVGMSGGIYGLFIVYILDVFKSRFRLSSQLRFTILINIYLNFWSNVAWAAHLGGLIGGLAIYMAISEPKNKLKISLCFVLLICLFLKFFYTKNIEIFYTGTDLNIINMYYNMGFKDYSLKLMNKLLLVYNKYGG